MATYNGEKYVRHQISSILNQIASEDELIISDDSSTDGTVQAILEINDPRIRLFTDMKFRDPIRNFQHALSHASGAFIFLADQDDVWMEHKYETLIKLLGSYDLVISDSKIVDEDLNVVHPSFFEYFNSRPGIVRNMVKSAYYGSCMAFNRDILSKALPFPLTKEIGHDLWIGLVAEMTGKVLFYKEPLILYRRHNNAFTPLEVGKSKRKISQKIYGRYVMITEVIRFFIKQNLKWKKG